MHYKYISICIYVCVLMYMCVLNFLLTCSFASKHLRIYQRHVYHFVLQSIYV